MHRSLRGVFMLMAALLLFAAGFLTTSVRAAAPIVRCVTTSGNAPPVATASGCATTYSSIHAAITAAASGDTIYVFANAGATAANPTTYQETLSINTSLTIVAVGAVAVDGRGNGSTVAINSDVTVALIGLTITGGTAALGGGIYANFLTHTMLIGLTVTGNVAVSSLAGGNGGGIRNDGTMTLINATVAGNTAKHSSTINAGGGNGGGIDNLGTLTLIHSTVTANTAEDYSAPFLGYGGGIQNYGTLALTNSLVAGNAASVGDDVDDENIFDTKVDSVVGDATGLGMLADNGGPTKTVAITAGSPAHDNAACATNPTTSGSVATDQRDLARPQGTTCDAGAFELTTGPAPPTFPISITTQSLPPAFANIAYSQLLAATRGTVPYAYTLLGGTLPTGLSLAANGTIADSTAQAGTFPIVVGVTDAGQFADIRALSLTVQPFALVVNSADDGAANVLNCLSGNASTCRLRDAVAVVNQSLVPASPTPTITFALPAGPQTITLTGGTLTIATNLTVDGTGATIAVDGNNAATVFTVNSGAAATINALTIQHGNGGIANSGTLTVTDSMVANNTAADGGGIFNAGGAVTITRSTFYGNNATSLNGGAIDSAFPGAHLTVTNSTFSGNTARGAGGGINNYQGTAMLTNVTLVNNGPNGDIASYANAGVSATTTLTNVLVARTSGGADLASLNGGVFAGNNDLTDDASGSLLGGTGTITGRPALLGPLGSYGGPTQTFALLPGSPAIDAGGAVDSGPGGAMVPAADQRGKARVGAVDIGAFESQGFTLTPAAGSTPQSALISTAFATPLALAVAANNPVEPVQGGVVAFAVTPTGNGASAILSGLTATIGAGGQANVTATANVIAGTYMVTASTPGATSATFALTNTAPVIALAPTTLSNGAAEQAYTQQLIASGAGSTPPFAFAVTMGTLPTGLTLDPTGLLHGTPTVTGPFTFTVTATDAHTFTGMQRYTLVLTAPTVVVAPTNLPAGVKGVAYPATTISASRGTAPYTFAVTAGALPGGLSLSMTGTLSGTPTTVATFTFTVTATDANGFAGMQADTISVTAAPLASIAVAPNPATVKVGQVQQFTATGTYQDGSTADLTSQVTWTSDASTVASVDTTGKATGKAAGSAHVTATQGAISGQTVVTVAPPVLTGVQAAPAPASRPSGASVPPAPAPAPAPAPLSR